MGGTTRTVHSEVYDAHGNRTRIKHPDGNYFEYAYDTADRLFQLFENGTTTLLATIGPDEQGRRDWITRNGGAVTDYEYDPISRLEILTHDLDGTGTAVNDAGFGFTFNPASQIITRVQINEAYEFPLTPEVESYVVNGRNQYTQVGGTTHTWDANGNLTDDGPTTYGYDTENRLVSAGSATLKYDPLGRLWEASTSSGVIRFVYDGDSLIAEYNNTGTLLRRYVHGAWVDEPLLWYEGATVAAGSRRYLHADHLGSVVAISSSIGAKLMVNAYDSYGVTNTANTSRFQFTGKAAIPELGLLYYRARMYSPSLGRFLQTDPIGYDDDLNLYAYVYNNPLNATDPTGTAADCTGSRVGAGCDFVQGSVQRTALLAGARPGGDRRGEGPSISSIDEGSESFEQSGSATELAPDDSSSTQSDSFNARMRVLIARGDTEGLKTLLEVASPEQSVVLRASIKRLESTANQIISKELRGSVNRVFPAEMREKTMAEINRLAQDGDRVAQTARKLLESSRFKK